jgi:formylglycine-generating enzyme required for sulfatase activity
MLRSLALIFVLLLAMPAAAQPPGTVVKDCPECLPPGFVLDSDLPLGTVVKDCPFCPEMVVVPEGYSRLASGGDVWIEKPFLVGKFEVTFEEYDVCVRWGACSCCPDDLGFGRGRRPVMDVSWNDAFNYVRWLSRRTGKSYRLLSDAEWQYAAQAGTGREARVTPGAGRANCDGCGSRWDGKRTAPVGSFPANAFGLHDMLGNVSEWTADCWKERRSYDDESDGSPRLDGDCSSRVIRGGSWNLSLTYARSGLGGRLTPGFPTFIRVSAIGFRVRRGL